MLEDVAKDAAYQVEKYAGKDTQARERAVDTLALALSQQGCFFAILHGRYDRDNQETPWKCDLSRY